VLIGMPGSGKSTVGVILAKLLARGFVDTDLLIQNDQDCSLQRIVDRDGYLVLRNIEERILLGLKCRNQVVATGGSAAYSHAAMTHLKQDGMVVFLHANLETLRARVGDYSKRGLAKRADQSLEDLFEERLFLYMEYADITIECSQRTHDEVCNQIITEIDSLLPADHNYP
jgi:shikimate kinase